MNTLRIAIRAEGQMVNAYVAMTSSMADDVHIGSFHRRLLVTSPELFDQFKELLKAAGAVLIEQVGGKKICAVFEQDAPEHEKAGHA